MLNWLGLFWRYHLPGEPWRVCQPAVDITMAHCSVNGTLSYKLELQEWPVSHQMTKLEGNVYIVLDQMKAEYTTTTHFNPSDQWPSTEFQPNLFPMWQN